MKRFHFCWDSPAINICPGPRPENGTNVLIQLNCQDAQDRYLKQDYPSETGCMVTLSKRLAAFLRSNIILLCNLSKGDIGYIGNGVVLPFPKIMFRYAGG